MRMMRRAAIFLVPALRKGRAVGLGNDSEQLAKQHETGLHTISVPKHTSLLDGLANRAYVEEGLQPIHPPLSYERRGSSPDTLRGLIKDCIYELLNLTPDSRKSWRMWRRQRRQVADPGDDVPIATRELPMEGESEKGIIDVLAHAKP